MSLCAFKLKSLLGKKNMYKHTHTRITIHLYCMFFFFQGNLELPEETH